MNKYIIYWNAGYGTTEEIVEAASVDEAQAIAELNCTEEMEQNCDYGARLLTKQLAEEEGYEWEEKEVDGT